MCEGKINIPRLSFLKKEVRKSQNKIKIISFYFKYPDYHSPKTPFLLDTGLVGPWKRWSGIQDSNFKQAWDSGFRFQTGWDSGFRFQSKRSVSQYPTQRQHPETKSYNVPKLYIESTLPLEGLHLQMYLEDTHIKLRLPGPYQSTLVNQRKSLRAVDGAYGRIRIRMRHAWLTQASISRLYQPNSWECEDGITCK